MTCVLDLFERGIQWERTDVWGSPQFEVDVFFFGKAYQHVVDHPSSATLA